jgi:hypothetical protein
MVMKAREQTQLKLGVVSGTNPADESAASRDAITIAAVCG